MPMTTKQKLVDLAFIFTMILLILLPIEVSAESNSNENERGSLQMQIDRIQKEKDVGTDNRVTEKEKVFPGLFNTETTDDIQQKAERKKDDVEALQDSVFTLDINQQATLEKVQDTLFTADYTSEAASGQNAADQTESDSGNGVLYFLIGIALALCIGLYMMMRKLLD
ncbi:type VII secretion protein EssA [Terribacillus halophilus]|uniref:Type VII secretion protein EssA n=2 Tax=Terribacillus halophilus TaxID=361279 RepID=A0A1G6PW10_9BACI|nr:type VII secretion protein EssA [Terribacillus halophilus]